jgi:hypothetical protein
VWGQAYAGGLRNLEDQPMSEKSTQELHQNVGHLEMRMRALEELVASLKSELDRLNQQLTSLINL